MDLLHENEESTEGNKKYVDPAKMFTHVSVLTLTMV